MKSLASLALVLTAPALAQEPPPGDGPRGSSQAMPGERRYDEVARAGVGEGVAVPGLASGEPVEITALDSGKTIVATSDVQGAAMLSARAAQMLGLPEGGAVRMRRAVVTPAETAELRQGAMIERIDAPASLLAGLRKRAMGGVAEAAKAVSPQPAASPPIPSKPAAKAPLPARAGDFWVQVASLSSKVSADALAGKVGGAVSPVGRLYRVRIGPLPDRPAAERARARAAALGYRDAAIVKSE